MTRRRACCQISPWNRCHPIHEQPQNGSVFVCGVKQRSPCFKQPWNTNIFLITDIRDFYTIEGYRFVKTHDFTRLDDLSQGRCVVVSKNKAQSEPLDTTPKFLKLFTDVKVKTTNDVFASSAMLLSRLRNWSEADIYEMSMTQEKLQTTCDSRPSSKRCSTILKEKLSFSVEHPWIRSREVSRGYTKRKDRS